MNHKSLLNSARIYTNNSVRACSRSHFVYIRGSSPGFAALTAVIFVFSISAVIISGLAFVALREVKITRNFSASVRSYYVAESGIEDAIYRFVSGKEINSGETIVLGTATGTINILFLGPTRTITVTGLESDTYRRAVEAVITSDSDGISFHYGVYAGLGGVRLENSAVVNGSVYSLGDVWGGEVTGDVFVASTSKLYNGIEVGGNAFAHRIDSAHVAGYATSTTEMRQTTVGQNAYADTFTFGSQITGTCYYKTSVSANSDCGTMVQISQLPADLPEIPFPVSDQQIADWESEAEDGGVYTGPCPYVISGGTVTLGPTKVNCDLTVKNSAVLVLGGPLWVSGNFSVENTAQVKLDPNIYSTGSGMIIADNQANRLTSSQVRVANSADVLGSGVASSSNTMLVSMNNSAETGGAEKAIEPKNNADGGIYYAPHGQIAISNATKLKEASAYHIHMANSSTLTYESGLANVNFTAGPTAGWVIQSWREVE